MPAGGFWVGVCVTICIYIYDIHVYIQLYTYMHTRTHTHMSPQCGTFWFYPAGLGSKILKRLIELSRMEGAACIKADVFCENKRALRFLEARRWGIEDFLVLNSLIMQVS